MVSSRWVDISKTLAAVVFHEIFSKASLPSKVTDIWDYLSGDQMFIEVEFKEVNSSGNAIKKNMKSEKYARADKKTVPMGGRKYFRAVKSSFNAKHIEIFDEKSSPSDPIKFNIGGEYLRPPKVDPANTSQDPLTLTIRGVLYGGNIEVIQLLLKDWK